MTGFPRIAGTFADFKLIKTRDVCQFVVEIPREQADAALDALGGLPKPGAEQWVALAPIQANAAVAHDRRQQEQATERKPIALASKIALTCRDPEFHEFMATDMKAFPVLWYKVLARMKDEPEPNVATAEALVKRQCDVQRKRDIEGNPEAYEQWLRLYRDFQQWRGSRELARRTGRAA